MAGPLRAGVLAAIALALAACAAQAPRPYAPPAELGQSPPATTTATPEPTTPTPPLAARCAPGEGAVVRIVDRGGAKAASQALQGGVLGGVLADGKPLPTKAATGYDIYVQMDDGRKLIVNQLDAVGIVVGARVGVEAGCRAHPTH